MSLKLLNQKRTVNYVIMLVLLIIFTFSLYSINFIYPKDPEKKQEIEQSPTMMKVRKVGRFVIPLVTLLSFFAACVVVAFKRFGGHVLGSAYDISGCSDRVLLCKFGQTKIGNPERVVSVQQQVGGFDVTV